MLVALVKQLMKNLRQILRYNKLFLFLIIFIFLYVLLFTKIIKYSSKYDGSEEKITGIVTGLKLDGNKMTLELKTREKIIANYYINDEKEKNNILNVIHLGDKVLLSGSLEKPLNNTIPNTFNYKKYLYNKKIYYLFNVSKYEIIKDNSLIYKVKDKLLKRIYRSQNNDYYLAFILGDKSLLASDIFNAYQKNGISHLLAISGMHINMLVLVISFLIKDKKKEFFIVASFLLFYLFLTGLSASIMRAILFYILKKVNEYGNFRYSNMHIIILIAVIILFVNPFMIYDLVFIYSFVVCFGISYYYDFLTGNYFIKLLKLSLITFLFSLPVTALVNYEFNLSSVFINLIFVPWVSIILYPFTLVTFIIPFLNPVLTFLINLTNNLNLFMENLSILINVPKMPIYLVILFYIVLLTKRKKYWVLLSLIIVLCKVLPYFNFSYNIYYLDVGQGDSSLLVSPHNKETILIDTGGKVEYKLEKWKQKSKTYHLSDNTIKFLKSKGITRLSYLIISHGDADHAKESLNIIDNIKVENVVLNHGDINYLEKDILATHVNVTEKYNLKYFNVKNLNNQIYDNENDNSIVNYITFLNYKLLFMGDAPIKVEKDLLKKYNIKNIDILKVGHHGSNTSSSLEFINDINPKYSIISVGRNNRYGHPKKEALNNLVESKIYRTDESGSIMFKIKNNKLRIETCVP